MRKKTFQATKRSQIQIKGKRTHKILVIGKILWPGHVV